MRVSHYVGMRGPLPRAGRILAVLAVLPLAACSSRPASVEAQGAPLGRDEVATAQKMARNAIAEAGSVSSATVIKRPSRAGRSSAEVPCGSGQVLQVKVIGYFPHFGDVPRLAGIEDPVYTALVMKADAESGQPCGLKALLGAQMPQPNGTRLSVGSAALLHPFKLWNIS